MNLVKLITIAGVGVLVTGCSQVYGPNGFIHPRPPAFEHVRINSQLRIPPGLSRSKLNNYYGVPHVGARAPKIEAPLVPPGSLREKVLKQNRAIVSLTSSAKTRHSMMSAINGQLALRVSGSVDSVWLRVGHALQQSGYRIINRNVNLHTYQLLLVQSLTQPMPVILRVKQQANNQSVVWLENQLGDTQIPIDVNKLLLTRVRQALPPAKNKA